MGTDPRRKRRRVARTALVIVGLVVALVAIVAAIGSALPIEHRATRESVFPAPRDSIFSAITDVERFPEWRSGLERVEPRPAIEGRPRWLEESGDGEILFEMAESVPGRRVVTRIADPDLPFGGTWTFELEDAAGGTRLRITEDGEVYNPIFRFMSRYVFGHHQGIERFLADLRRRTGG